MTTAFITGAAGFIGSVCAKTLAKNGIQIAVVDIVPEAIEKTVGEIRDDGGIAEGFVCDITNPAEVESVMDNVVKKLGSLDIMIHVAGGSHRIADGPNAEHVNLVDQQEWVIRKVIDVNMMGGIWCSRAAAKIMIKQGNGGRIINFSSIVGKNGLANHCDYAASKGGIMGFTPCLAKELGQYGITVNSVAPGVVMHDWETTGDERAYGTNFLRKKCVPQDVANLVEFLVSDKAGFITGQTYIIDGGRSLAMKGSDV